MNDDFLAPAPTNPNSVTLTDFEVWLAYSVVGQIAGQNLSVGRQPRYGADKNDFGIAIVGALGEIAVAKLLNKYWAGNVGDLSARDVDGLQVRSSALHRNLILHPQDSDNDPFVFVAIERNTATVCGWMLGKDGKDEKYWRADKPRPAFFIPERDLKPFRKEDWMARQLVFLTMETKEAA